MKRFAALFSVTCLAFLSAGTTKAATIAQWTFESLVLSAPSQTTPGAGVWVTNISADIGSGTISALHAAASTYSTPVGQGSTRSFSSTAWTVNDFYQLAISTVTVDGFYTNLTLSFDITASNTGPGRENLYYSLDGSSFTAFGGTSNILANATPNFTWNSTTATNGYNKVYDLGSVTDLANASVVYFRILDSSTTSANGGTVAAGGTERIDNVIISGTVVAIPEPSALALALLGGFSVLGLTIFRRRNK